MSDWNESLSDMVKRAMLKNAFAPMPPAPAGGAPPMDPAMMDPAMMAGGGGTPPMDPAMMGAGGAPPMDPAMMDPAMMDPAMMGGAPPMDPAMMGGAPPPPAPGGETVTVSLDDLKQIFAEAAQGSEPDKTEGGRVTNKDLDARLEELSQVVYSLANAMGVAPPVSEAGGAEMGAGAPEDLAALMGAGAAPPMAGPEGAPVPEGTPSPDELVGKVASENRKITAKEATEELDPGDPGYLRRLMLNLHQNR